MVNSLRSGSSFGDIEIVVHLHFLNVDLWSFGLMLYERCLMDPWHELWGWSVRAWVEELGDEEKTSLGARAAGLGDGDEDAVLKVHLKPLLGFGD